MTFRDAFVSSKSILVDFATLVVIFLVRLIIPEFILVNVPAIRKLYAWLLQNLRWRSKNFVMDAIGRSYSPKKVIEVLDQWKHMAYAPDGNGCTALHWACHPLLCGDVDIVRRLLELYPEAVRVPAKHNQTTPLNYILSSVGFGQGDPNEVRRIEILTKKELPNNGFIYTAANTTICDIIEMLVRTDPSTLMMKAYCKYSDGNINPIQQLWNNYERSSIGKREIKYAIVNREHFLKSLIVDGFCDDERFGGMVVVWRAMSTMIRALYAYIDCEAKKDRSTPLIHACAGIGDYCSSSFLDFLLALDLDQASRRDMRGNLPLHVSVKSSQFESPDSKAARIAKLVQSYPKGPRCRNDDGLRPITLGVIHDNKYGPWVEPLLNVGLGPREWAMPFLQAASYESLASLDMAYHVLKANPVSVLMGG